MDHSISIEPNHRLYKGGTFQQAKSYESLMLAYYTIVDHIGQQGWDPNWLNETQLSGIMTLNSEKYRQKKLNL